MASYVVTVLDYGAGNVRSLRNAIRHLGYQIKDAETVEDINNAEVIVFPGQGCFHQAIQSLRDKGWFDALKEYLQSNRPFFGICLGMQLLFEESEESPGVQGLGVIPGKVTRFSTPGAKVPQIGWNGMAALKASTALEKINAEDKVYFVHSFCALPTPQNYEWILTMTDYESQQYISMVQKGNVVAAQFHPEKSGRVGLQLIDSFLSARGRMTEGNPKFLFHELSSLPKTSLAKRIIACLDVRSNDQGDLVVTKGDQYDVRESSSSHGRGGVRNLGKPVALCNRYYEDGADEVAFLNITSFRQGVIEDLPMLQVLESSSENVFVPITVGGGIREYQDPSGKLWSSLEVAGQYFRAGADKVSIGSDAVYSAENYLKSRVKDGSSSIEQITGHYGAQAVVVSIDPKRVYVHTPDSMPTSLGGTDELSRKTVVELDKGFGPNGERYCWWQVTVKGGRETRDVDAVQLAKISEILGAGEIMLNCIDMDGQGDGYDLALIKAVQSGVTIPVIASSGAGNVNHFSEVFEKTSVNAALAAGIFHRNEVSIQQVKQHLQEKNIEFRR